MPKVDAGEPREILVLIVDAGGGHRSTANALLSAAEGQDLPFRLHVESLQAVFEPLDVFQRITGVPSEEIYNALIQHRLTRFLVPLLWIFQRVIRFRWNALKTRLRDALRERSPILVLSLAPNFNGVIRDASREARIPFFILLTDYADFPPHFWMETGVDRVIVGTEAASDQARALGIPEERVSRVSGMALHRRFYAPGRDRRALREEFGIPQDAFALLVLFGGVGSPEIDPLCERLLASSTDWHVVAISGRNPGLEARLRSRAEGAAGRLHVVGFTERVADFMAATDLILTKPGPGTLAEALHVGRPLVVAAGVHTVPQERFNARFVLEKGLGLVVEDWPEFPRAVRMCLENGGAVLSRLSESVRALPPNRAVFEILDLLRGFASAPRVPAPAELPRYP
jgi:1,2-diacylglycerol 3-beta-galactosyltransferase